MIRKCNISFLKQFITVDSPLFTAGCCLLFGGLALLGKWMEPVISRDGIFYLQMVSSWQETGSYAGMLEQFMRVEWIPAFPLFLIKILGDCGIPLEVAGVGLSLLMGATLPLLVSLMAQLVQHDQRVSNIACLLMAVNPPMIELAHEIQRDMIYIVFCGWCIFFCLKGMIEKKLWPWIPVGVLFSCAMLTRYETAEILPALVVVWCFLGLRKVIGWLRICGQCALFAVLAAVTAAGLICIMGIQDHIGGAYFQYFNGKAVLLKEQVIFDRMK